MPSFPTVNNRFRRSYPLNSLNSPNRTPNCGTAVKFKSELGDEPAYDSFTPLTWKGIGEMVGAVGFNFFDAARGASFRSARAFRGPASSCEAGRERREERAGQRRIQVTAPVPSISAQVQRAAVALTCLSSLLGPRASFRDVSSPAFEESGKCRRRTAPGIFVRAWQVLRWLHNNFRGSL